MKIRKTFLKPIQEIPALKNAGILFRVLVLKERALTLSWANYLPLLEDIITFD